MLSRLNSNDPEALEIAVAQLTVAGTDGFSVVLELAKTQSELGKTARQLLARGVSGDDGQQALQVIVVLLRGFTLAFEEACPRPSNYDANPKSCANSVMGFDQTSS